MTWRDPKRRYWLLGLVVPTLPFLAWAHVRATGQGIFWWLGPLVVFGLVPFVDHAIGKDASNPPEAAVGRLEADRYYRWCVYLFLPLQFASLVFACWMWTYGGLATAEKLGLALTVAMVAGISINTAHELGHKRSAHEKWLSKLALAQTGYGHFFVEHNRGHHVRVATPEDPASARLGESFWEFLPRTVWGSLRSALELERARLARAGKPFLTLHNDVLNAWAISALLFGALVAIFGVGIVPWLAVQAVVGFSLLEVVNYIEHYGLLRQRTRRRALRALPARAQLELEQHRLEPVPLPPAAPLRSPREPDPALPGAAPLRGPARAALGLCRDDPARLCPAALAPRDGSARGRALRRRRRAREHPSARARADPRAVRGAGGSRPSA